MSRKDETVYCAMFQGLYLGGLAAGRPIRDEFPVYVYQTKWLMVTKWVAVICDQHCVPIAECATPEACMDLAAVRFQKLTRPWREGFWDGIGWTPRTSRPAPGQVLA